MWDEPWRSPSALRGTGETSPSVNPTVFDSNLVNTVSKFVEAHAVSYNLGLSVALVLFAGFASGMTVGLLSIDPIQLRVLREEGSLEERRQAEKLEKVLSQHHLLLVTLLLANAIAMEALPLFLTKTVPEWLAIFLSVTAILLFGEIVPQALCTGRWQMPIVMFNVNQKALPLIHGLMLGFFGLSWPIAKLLDALLGHNEQTFYARSHLKALIRLHQRGNRDDIRGRQLRDFKCDGDDLDSALGADEVVIIEGALDLATKHVVEIMVPLQEVYMLEWSTPLTQDLRFEILQKGHSRIPVYQGHRHNVRGLLLVKSLIVLDARDYTPIVSEFTRANRPPIFCLPSLQLYDLLNEFRRGRHMAFISNNPELQQQAWETAAMDDTGPHLLGICTLEDVIEELIQEEIYDEFDNYTANLATTSKQSSEFVAVTDQSRHCPPLAASKQMGPRRSSNVMPDAGDGEVIVLTTRNTRCKAVKDIRPPRDVQQQYRDTLIGKLPLFGAKLQDLQKRLIDEPNDGERSKFGQGLRKQANNQDNDNGRWHIYATERRADDFGNHSYRRCHSFDQNDDNCDREISTGDWRATAAAWGIKPPGRGIKNVVGIAAAKQKDGLTKGGSSKVIAQRLLPIASLDESKSSPASSIKVLEDEEETSPSPCFVN